MTLRGSLRRWPFLLIAARSPPECQQFRTRLLLSKIADWTVRMVKQNNAPTASMGIHLKLGVPLKFRFILRCGLIEETFRIVRTDVRRNGLKIGPNLVMIFADAFEKNYAPGNVHIHQVRLPSSRAYPLAMNLKTAALVHVTKQTIAEVDAVNHCAMHGDKPLETLIDLDRSGHSMENTRLVGGRIESRIWPEAE